MFYLLVCFDVDEDDVSCVRRRPPNLGVLCFYFLLFLCVVLGGNNWI